RFSFGNHTVHGGNFFETFLLCYICKVRIKIGPLFIFSFSCCFQVLGGSSDDTCGESCCNLHHTSLEVSEHSLGMRHFLIGCFLKDGRNLLIPLFFCLLGKKGVAHASL